MRRDPTTAQLIQTICFSMSARVWQPIFFSNSQLQHRSQQNSKFLKLLYKTRKRNHLKKSKSLRVRVTYYLNICLGLETIKSTQIEQDSLKNRRVDRCPHVDKKHYAKVCFLLVSLTGIIEYVHQLLSQTRQDQESLGLPPYREAALFKRPMPELLSR